MDTTSQIKEELTEVEETTVQSTELEAGYIAPMLTISRTRSVGEDTDSVRVELHQCDLIDSPGAVITFADTTLRALMAEDTPSAATATTVQFSVTPVTPEMVSALQQHLVKERGVAQAVPPATEVELQEALDRAEHDAAESAREHGKQVGYLRDLIVQARKDKRVADAAADGQCCPGGC